MAAAGTRASPRVPLTARPMDEVRVPLTARPMDGARASLTVRPDG